MWEPSGWYFEFANEYYPDIDDTAQVLLALAATKGTHALEQDETIKRAVNWLLAMQSKDGGWAAFDVDNNWEFFELGSVCRSQCDARSDVPGYYGARARGPGRVRLAAGSSGGAARRGFPGAVAGS